MRILVAPDSFKGTLSASRAAEAIAQGVRRAIPDAEIVVLPFADGGEGTVDAVVAVGAHHHATPATGPLGEIVVAHWASLGDTAVIEMAAASGLHLVTPNPESALAASTVGTGTLIRAALDAGARRIVIGVGGSATTDGGRGALEALGAVFGTGLDLSGLDPRLAETELVLCTDVANAFRGPGGAAQVFAPQKGADAATVAALDARLGELVACYRDATGVDLDALGWGGAGGGLAGGLHAALGARPANGADVVAELVGLDALIATSDLVIVGEGSLDAQSLLGKAPIGIARRSRAAGVPVIAIVGRSQFSGAELLDQGIVDIATADEAGSVAEAAEVALGRLRI